MRIGATRSPRPLRKDRPMNIREKHHRTNNRPAFRLLKIKHYAWKKGSKTTRHNAQLSFSK